MITENNIRKVLTVIGFSFDEKTDRYIKEFPEYGDCSMIADCKNKKLIYPNEILGRERNTGFDQNENFVVFECVHRLLEKGYRPENIELEKVWSLGHEQKSGRADICVYRDTRKSPWQGLTKTAP